jgi:hypothetical protein
LGGNNRPEFSGVGGSVWTPGFCGTEIKKQRKAFGGQELRRNFPRLGKLMRFAFF